MNKLFTFSAALDCGSTHGRIQEFWRLDAEIHELEERLSLTELFHSLEYSVLKARAKNIIKQLNNTP